MERFLERLSLSSYKDNFIIKGGILVASMVGLDNRATMDIDTTIVNFSLNKENTTRIIKEIASIDLQDNMSFIFRNIETIMDDADYQGLRIMMDAYLDKTKIPLKIDISTGDVITPKEIEYEFKLMFENRTIQLWAYNLETVLAEKLESVLSRGSLNTRMRDFYDLYIMQIKFDNIDWYTLKTSIEATSKKRNSWNSVMDGGNTLNMILNSTTMKEHWFNYQKKNAYACNIKWETVLESIITLFNNIEIPM